MVKFRNLGFFPSLGMGWALERMDSSFFSIQEGQVCLVLFFHSKSYCSHAPVFLSTRLLSNFNLKLILPYPHPWFHLFSWQQPQILSTANLVLLTQCFAYSLAFLSGFFSSCLTPVIPVGDPHPAFPMSFSQLSVGLSYLTLFAQSRLPCCHSWARGDLFSPNPICLQVIEEPPKPPSISLLH